MIDMWYNIIIYSLAILVFVVIELAASYFFIQLIFILDRYFTCRHNARMRVKEWLKTNFPLESREKD
jgi:hypothetical protein